jgi:hypothetical protein
VLPVPGVKLGTVGETVFELPLDGTIGDVVGLNPPNEEEGEVEDEVDEGMLGVPKEPEFAGIDGVDGMDGVDGIDGIEGILLTGLLLLAGTLSLLLIELLLAIFEDEEPEFEELDGKFVTALKLEDGVLLFGMLKLDEGTDGIIIGAVGEFVVDGMLIMGLVFIVPELLVDEEVVGLGRVFVMGIDVDVEVLGTVDIGLFMKFVATDPV